MSGQNPLSFPPKAVVPLWDVLVRIRLDMQLRSVGPYLYMGLADTGWMANFVSGYAQCMSRLGAPLRGYDLFHEWLEIAGNPEPGKAWDERYLEDFSGNHDSAVRKYLDRVAEFLSHSPEVLEGPALNPTLRPTSTLNLLLEARRVAGDVPGRLGMFIGDIKVQRMAGLVRGHQLCLELAGSHDEEYARFEQWLHQEKGMPMGQSWEQFLLQACNEDHEQATLRLLDCAAEFRAVGG
jgi:hypothetical protein